MLQVLLQETLLCLVFQGYFYKESLSLSLSTPMPSTKLLQLRLISPICIHPPFPISVSMKAHISEASMKAHITEASVKGDLRAASMKAHISEASIKSDLSEASVKGDLIADQVTEMKFPDADLNPIPIHTCLQHQSLSSTFLEHIPLNIKLSHQESKLTSYQVVPPLVSPPPTLAVLTRSRCEESSPDSPPSLQLSAAKTKVKNNEEEKKH